MLFFLDKFGFFERCKLLRCTALLIESLEYVNSQAIDKSHTQFSLKNSDSMKLLANATLFRLAGDSFIMNENLIFTANLTTVGMAYTSRFPYF